MNASICCQTGGSGFLVVVVVVVVEVVVVVLVVDTVCMEGDPVTVVVGQFAFKH